MVYSEGTFFESQCMFVCDQISLNILDLNDIALKKIGKPRNEILGKSLTDFGRILTTNEDGLNENSVANILSDKTWELFNSKGERFEVRFSAHLITYKGRPSKLIIVHELPETKHSEAGTLYPISAPVEFSNFPMAEIEWDKDLKVLQWSKKAEELFGWTQEEAINHPNLLKEFVFYEDLKLVLDEVQETLEQKRNNVSLVNRNVTKSGKVIYCEWYNSFLFDDNGELVSLLSLTVDVTQRVEAMERAHRNMQNYKDLFDAISDAVYLVSEEGKILGANEGTKLTFGYEIEDLIGKDFQFLSASGKFKYDQMFDVQEDESGKSTNKFEGWGKKANGEVFPTEMLVNSGSYFGQNVLIIVERDISERKLAEEELVKREALLSELFNTSPLGIALLNQYEEVIEVNNGFEKLFEYSFNEISGLELDKVLKPETYVDFSFGIEIHEADEGILSRIKTKSGEILDLIVYDVPIVINGKTLFAYRIFVDLADRKRYEEDLQHSLKEKEILLAEIHHRIKNNLAVITGLLELQSDATKNNSAKNILRDSSMRIHSIALVHEKLYDNENFSEIQINEYIRELSKTIQQTIGYTSVPTKITFDLDEILLPLTQAIPCGLLLNEVLTNCFKHAFIDKEGGLIHVSFKQIGDELIFNVSDNGIGITNEKNIDSDSSMGMKLIRILAKQLASEMEITISEGTVLEFKFKRQR